MEVRVSGGGVSSLDCILQFAVQSTAIWATPPREGKGTCPQRAQPHGGCPPQKRSPSLDISLHGTERSREQGGGISRTLPKAHGPPSHLHPLAQQLWVKADGRAHLASPSWVQALSQATTSSCLWTRLRSGRFSDRPFSIPASSSSILSILLLAELACLPEEDMGQKGVEGLLWTLASTHPPATQVFSTNNREHLNPRGKKEGTERFTEAPPSSDGGGVHLASEGT